MTTCAPTKAITFDFEAIAAQLWRVTKPGGVVVWVVGDATINGSETGTSFRQALHFMGLGFNLHDTMIYEVDGRARKAAISPTGSLRVHVRVQQGMPKTVYRIAHRGNVTAGAHKFHSPKLDTQDRGRQHRNETTAAFGIRANIWRYHCVGWQRDDLTDHPAPFPEPWPAIISPVGAIPATWCLIP